MLSSPLAAGFPTGALVAPTPYAELHCHTNFSFLDGASAPDDLVERAVELGLTGLAVTDHNGLYGAVRFVSAAEAAGLHPVVGLEIELLRSGHRRPGRDRHPAASTAPPPPRPGDPGGTLGVPGESPPPDPAEGRPPAPTHPRPTPGHRAPVKEDLRGIGERVRGPHLVLLARSSIGWRSMCRLISHANMAGTKGMPRFSQALLAEHTEGLVALSGCRDGELIRRLRTGDLRRGPRGRRALRDAVRARRWPGTSGFFIELSHHLLPDDDWLVGEAAALAEAAGLPVVVTNDAHYARPEDRELADVLTAIRHGRSLETLGDLRRPDGESYLKSGAELAALGSSLGEAATAAWTAGISTAVELAASCSVDLGFEQYRFPGFPVPDRETPFSYLSELCWAGARKRYHPVTSAVMSRLAHELEVIERAGLAEFFLICWDLMRFAKEQGIPAQGRGSATSSIVSYTLGISRVEPIAHNLLFERFINPGRTTYPDVDIDFSSERREEVIQYVYNRYGPEHTGMVCNLVTYRARSAVREVGYALGFPRPLVDRVAKALETYDSVMVRRDLEADGGFAEFFRRPGEGLPAEAGAAQAAEALGFVDGMGQLNTRVPLVGKVPPWRQPPKPEDPNAPRPFALAPGPRAIRTAAPAGEWRDLRECGRALPDSPPGDPAGRPTRRRGWSGRHPGQRRLAAGRPRDRLQGGYGSAGGAAAHRRPADRPGEWPARAAAARRRTRAVPPTSWVDRRAGIRRRRDAPTRAPRPPTSSVARIEPEPPPEARAARRSVSRTGSAGSSSAPASTASRATCRSIRAGCW